MRYGMSFVSSESNLNSIFLVVLQQIIYGLSLMSSKSDIFSVFVIVMCYSCYPAMLDNVLMALDYADLFNTLGHGQNDRHFADDIFKHILLNESYHILIKNRLKFVQVMAGHLTNDMPLPDPMFTQIYDAIVYFVPRPQWVKVFFIWFPTVTA